MYLVVILYVTSLSFVCVIKAQRPLSSPEEKMNISLNLESEEKQVSSSLNQTEALLRRSEKSTEISKRVHHPLIKKTRDGSLDLIRQKKNLSSYNVSSSLTCERRLSCEKKCENTAHVSHNDTLSCFCDVDCVFFKDCCADYGKYCDHKNESGISISTQDNLVNQQNRDLWGCFMGKRQMQDTKGIWMIRSCPRSWPKDDILYQCRNLSNANKITKDNYRYLPVYTNNGRVYRNRFCAQCNGIPLSSEMKYFELSFSCQVSPPSTLNQHQRMDFLFSYCDSNKINWVVPANLPRRYCLDIKEPSFPCRTPDLQDKCINGSTAVVFISIHKGNYKNLHCAKCDDLSSYQCGPQTTLSGAGIFPDTLPFSVIFNFKNENSNGKSSIKIDCPFQHVYDHYLEICRKGYKNGLPSSSTNQEYETILWFRFKLAPVSDPDLARISLLINLTTPRTLGMLFKVNSSQVSDPTLSLKSKMVFNLRFNIRFYHKRQKRTRRSSDQSSFQPVSFEQILNWKSPFDISIFGQNLTLFKANTRVISCTNLQKYSGTEYTVLQDGTSAVFIKKTGEVFQAKEYYTDSTSTNKSQAIFVCRQHIQQISINCSGVFVLMKANEFTLLQNRSIFVNASKQVYNWSEYTWQNNSVLVCENFSTTYYKTSNVTKDKLLRTITVFCMLLSIIALVFVLVTYSLFSELRTPPGINLINLSVSILLAQLLWILGSGQTNTPIACTVIAIILHYLFLVSFMWTSIIAFDTWRAFSSKGRRQLADSRHQRIKHSLRYMAVGWLSVMMYVIVCVVLDLTDTVNIGYKAGKGCWMGDHWATLLFFAVPVGLFLIFNMVFYVMTLRAINVTTAQARAASDHNTKQNFAIYVRIASLMGFPWIFGFLAPFGWYYLWYPFVVLSGLEGVYIAFAFAFNKRVRDLYKKRLRLLKCSNFVSVLVDSRSSNKNTAVPLENTILNEQYQDTKL